jgi:hypothetical protein
MAEVDPDWNRMGTAQRFGALRSALAQGPSQAGFIKVCRMLHAMERQAPARFADEVLPYAQEGLERWYALCPLPADGGGELRWDDDDRLARTLQQGLRWPGVLRCVTASPRRLDRLLAGARLEGLRRLELDRRWSWYEPQIREIWEAPWLSQLTALTARSLMVTPLAGKIGELGRLEALELRDSLMAPSGLKALGQLEGLRRVGLPYRHEPAYRNALRMYDLTRHYGGWRLRWEDIEEALAKLLATARWRAVEALGSEEWTPAMTQAVAKRRWPVRSLRLGAGATEHGAALIEALGGVEELSLHLVGAAQLSAMLEAGTQLRTLRLHSYPSAAQEVLAALRSSPRASQLERVAVGCWLWQSAEGTVIGGAQVEEWPDV